MRHEIAVEADTSRADHMAKLLAISAGAKSVAFGSMNVECGQVTDFWSSQGASGADDCFDTSAEFIQDLLFAFVTSEKFESELSEKVSGGEGSLWLFDPMHLACIGNVDTYPVLYFVVFLFNKPATRDTENFRNLARIGMNYVGTLAPSYETEAVTAELPSSIAESVLECLSFGYIVLDASGRVHAMKDSVDGWLATNTVFEIRNNRLTARRQRDRQIFLNTIQAASDSRKKVSALLLGRNQSAMRATVFVMPINGSNGLVLMTFGQATSDQEFRDIALAAMGLTPAERRLTQSLVEGMSVQEAATEANVTVSTARSYLKSIFQKTAIRSQSQLVTLCLNLTPAISHSNVNRAIDDVAQTSEPKRRPANAR